jgi:hypothetical protein
MAAIFSFSLAGCENGGDDEDIVPAELQGNWLRDSGGTERYLRFSDSRWATESDGPVSNEDISNGWVITSAKGNRIEYQSPHYPAMDTTGSFEWAISGTTLTISNSDHSYMSNDTYTKQ